MFDNINIHNKDEVNIYIEQLPIFNNNVINDLYGGSAVPSSTSIFSKCSEMMINNYPERIKNLTESIENKNYNKIIFYAHQLRGSFHATGGARAAFLSWILEHHSKNMTQLEIQEIAIRLQNEFNLLQNELNRFLTDIKNSGQSTDFQLNTFN